MGDGGVIRRLRRGLAALLDPDHQPPRPSPAETPLAPVAPPHADFDAQLRQLVAKARGAPILSGRINFIGMQRIRQQFGAGWEQVAERANRIARKTIERHLAPGDIYTALQGPTYVVVFARLSQEPARLKCLMIAEEIAKALLGESGAELLEIKTAVKRVDGNLGLETLSHADQLFAAMLPGDELDMVEPPAAGFAKPAPAAAAPRAAQQQDLLAHLRFYYRPTWDHAHNVISSFLCAAQALSGDSRAVLGDAEVIVQGEPEDRAKLDTRLLEHVVKELQALLRDGRRLLLTLPVHFDTLAAASRQRDYLQLLARVDDDMRKQLLIEIAGIPHGVPQSRLSDLTTPLRRRCLGVLLRLPIDTADFLPAKGCGAIALGCDATERHAAEAVIMRHLNAFARNAEKAGFRTYARGLKSVSLVAAALGAGFSYIGGGAVAEPVDHPRSIVNFRLADLYRPLIAP